MAAVATFVGFTPPQPDGRDFEIFRLFPQINREEDETRDLLRFANVMQELFNLVLADIDRFVDIFDVDRAPEGFLDAMLADLGNPFSFDLDANGKRKLIRVLVGIYRLKGTTPGVVNTLRFFLGLESAVVDFNDEDQWVLGESELGTETFLGVDDLFAIYSFDVEVDRVLTPDERDLVRTIVDFIKPAHTHHINTLEP